VEGASAGIQSGELVLLAEMDVEPVKLGEHLERALAPTRKETPVSGGRLASSQAISTLGMMARRALADLRLEERAWPTLWLALGTP
jgi:hypothetical protein